MARNGYNIEQNPKVPGTREPDYIIEGEIFDCYSPEPNTKVRGIWSNIFNKVVEKKQTERVIINLNDWLGNVDDIVNNLKDYPIDGLKEVIVIKEDNVISIYP